MKITLQYEEIRHALMRIIEKKTEAKFGNCQEDDCYFTFTNDASEKLAVNDVEFTAILDNNPNK